jgi:hypothetical protein
LKLVDDTGGDEDEVENGEEFKLHIRHTIADHPE